MLGKTLVPLLCWLGASSAQAALPETSFKMLPSARIYQGLLFPDSKIPGCQIVGKGLSNNRKADLPEIWQIIEPLMQMFSVPKPAELRMFFHPRLKMNESKALKLINEIRETYGFRGQVDVNLYRVFALNTVDGTPNNLECNDDRLSIGPHYGFPIQFGAWLQISGKNELGRLYVSIVPTESSWRIAAWHLQQWTHAGKDAEAWVSEALTDSAKQNKAAAYAKLDMAYKLLDGGKFVYLQLRKDIEATRSSMLPGEDGWLKAVQAAAPKEPIVYAGTYLAPQGVGILIRVTIEKELNLKDKEKVCSGLAEKIYSAAWTAPLAGTHCDFTTPNAPPERRGTIGGITINRLPKTPRP